MGEYKEDGVHTVLMQCNVSIQANTTSILGNCDAATNERSDLV